MRNLKLFIFAAVAAVSIVTVRIIQLVFLTDSRTGFYLESSLGLATALTAFVTVIAVFASAMGFFVKKELINSLPKYSVPLGSTALLAGASSLVEPFLYKSYISDTVPPALDIARLAMIICSGLVFIYLGYCYLFLKTVRYEITVVTVIALLVRLMTTFVSYSGMSNISENTIDVIMLVTTLGFFHLQSKAFCGIKNKLTVSLLFVFGISAALSSLLSAVPGIAVTLFSSVKVMHAPVDSPVTTLFTSVYIVVYLINISKNAVILEEK